LQMSAIHFVPTGPLVEHHGMRQPSFGDIETVLSRIQREQWDVWNYLTMGGKLWYERTGVQLEAA